MGGNWRSQSNEKLMEDLNNKIDETRNIAYSFSQPINQGGRSVGIGGKGSASGAFGSTSGNQIFNPTRTPITNLDINGVALSNDRINIQSRNMIVIGTDPSNLNVKWIQRATADGQVIYLMPEAGKTLTLKVGGNIDIASEVVISDNQIVELMFALESDVSPTNDGFIIIGIGGAGGGLSFPILYPEENLGDVGSQSVNISLAGSTSHFKQMKLIGDISLTFNNPPASDKFFEFWLMITQNATGGWDVISVPGALKNGSEFNALLDKDPNAVSVFHFVTGDGGVSYHAELIDMTSTGGATTLASLSDVLIAGLADKDMLQYDSASGKWKNTWFMKFGTNPADVGILRTSNNLISLGMRDQTNTNNFEVKFDTSNRLDLTYAKDGSPTVMILRAQHLTQPDNIFSMSQAAGSGGATLFGIPTEMIWDVGSNPSALFINQNTMELDVDLVMNGSFIDEALYVGSNSASHADSGFIRTHNNSIGLSFRNAANNGNLELKVDTSNFFDFTHSANGNVTLGVRAQHAVDPDATLYITQNSGSAGDTIFRAPYTGKFQAGAFEDVMDYTTARIMIYQNLRPATDASVTPINLGVDSIARFNQIWASAFMFEAGNSMTLSTLGMDFSVNNNDYIRFTVNSVQKLDIQQLSSTLFGDWLVTSDLTIDGTVWPDEVRLTEQADPTAVLNNAFIYAKEDANGITDVFARLSDSSIWTLGRKPIIVAGNSQILITDTGTGTINLDVDGATVQSWIAGQTTLLQSLVMSGASINLGGNNITAIVHADFNTTGATASTNRIGATTSEMFLCTATGDDFQFYQGGSPILKIEDDGTIQWTISGRQHRIDVTSTELQLISEVTSDDITFWTGASRSNATVTIDDNATYFRTTITQNSAYVLDIVQNNDTPLTQNYIAGVRGIAENSASVDTPYVDIAMSTADSITNGSENGRLELFVVSAGSIATPVIELLGSASGLKLGFFGTTPVVQQTVGSDTLANLYTALRASGIIG